MGENYLIVDTEGNATEVSGEIKIGRNKTNELVISDPLASRHHATVYMEGEIPMIRDEGSSNGTYVNGKQIYEPTALNDQDKIQFGDEEYTIRAPLWDSATVRAPKEGEEPEAKEDSTMSKKAPETSAGPGEPAGETVVSELPVEEMGNPPKKDNSRMILIIAIAVILLCFCCLVIAGVVVWINRTGSSLIGSGVLGQLQQFTSSIWLR
ncbi:MAG: FHA domain-containing protein [Anaerolineales bacterium]